ncbi:N-acetyl-gamma-glutamyl-phosphate reductase [Oricola cellulosilytica]|uniref:N-acetyl-gamma-glutamyl-phosphate reductase n=1 Tax=Oricola cellulosilytica TaxID=1429082 RepID=A0A4R0PAZ2_9HYPH|nr:N-acetyl-gamma-glutamyl-phosphate reductase [Oricola cellulosilytica]TCD14411.1 N-acetyl-gamma-glutamyl-phosphate reductase [Oricola cellulosilytica]
MKPKLFIDGEHGTTGLQIRQRIAARDDLEVLSIPEAERRNAALREELLKSADIAILCLPDDAAREAVAMLTDAHTRIIDTSTAHRTHDDWVYGFAESEPGQGERIAEARYVSNPGCYSTGAIGLLRPLTRAGILPGDYPVTINAVSGYTGGGKQMIAQMEDEARDDHIAAPHFLYATALRHKHVPEIQSRSGLAVRPLFSPSVGRFAQGMLVQVPLHLDAMDGRPAMGDIHAVLAKHYDGQDIVEVVPLAESAAIARLDPTEMAGTDRMKLFVFGTDGDGQVNLVASLDNLGKGASGAAVQNLDLMIGA